MGLILSVLVLFVGMVEVLDCWNHFSFGLIRHRRAVLSHSSSKSEALPERAATPAEFKKLSHVDIHWPKDISPADDLHVIKKRPHLERSRSSEHEELSSRCRNVESDCVDSIKHIPSPPHILVHCPSIDDPVNQNSPKGSRETSPNLLELSVIVESDSSSDIEEPSQVENPEYTKRIAAEAAIPSQSVADNNIVAVASTSGEGLVIIDERRESESIECISQSPCSIGKDHLKPNGFQSEKLEVNKNSEYNSQQHLPIFTDNILSNNVMKVSCKYATEIKNTNEESIKSTEKYTFNANCATMFDSLNNSSSLNALERFTSQYNQSISKIPTVEKEVHTKIFDEAELVRNNYKNGSELPKITLLECTSIDLDDDSDSSLNTSDASCMIKSRGSDQSLKDRCYPTAEEIARAFLSVTQVDLQAFESPRKTKKPTNPLSKCINGHEVSQELQLEAETLVDDIIETAVKYILKDILLRSDVLNGLSGVGGCFADPEKYYEANSSSSSLSGIPPLPEDTSDSNYTCLPSNNGYCDSFGEYFLGDSFSYKDDSLHSLSSIPTEEDNVRVRDVFEVSKQERNNDVFYQVNNHRTDTSPPIDGNNGNENEILSIVKKDASSIINTDVSKVSWSEGCDNRKEDDVTSPSKSPSAGISSDCCDPSEIKKNITLEESEDKVIMCRAKRTKLQDQTVADNQCVQTAPPASIATPSPSSAHSGDQAKPSTSKESDNPEEKASWLIFSGEYTKAMNKDWHSGHFCCWQCDESLTGQRYVLRDEHPYCIKCYESVFANGCEECSKTIGIDSKDLSYKDKHWHEACFLCNKCRVSLVDKQFGSKLDKIFCGNCYDAQFASRCDGCGQIFKAGTKKMEYKTRQWHEPCFSCCVCKTSIGTKSFIPREQEIYCATCYEEKFATRCVKCNKIITSGGVTYKNEPWHRECFTCTNCNSSLAGQRFTSKEEKPYCADCFGELFAKRCTACCKPITGIGGTRFVSFEDRHWHNDCFVCASCKTSLVGRGFITDGDDIICPECAKQKLM